MIGRKYFIILVTQLIISGLEAIVFLWAAKIYLPENFGYLNVVNSFFAFFLILCDLENLTAHLKKMAEKEYDSNQYFSVYASIKAILVFIMSVVFIFIIWLQFETGYLKEDQTLISVMIIVFLNSIVYVVNTVYTSSFQAILQIAKMQSAIFLGRVVQIVIQFIVIIYNKFFTYYVFSILIGQIVTFLVNLLLGRHFRFKKLNAHLLHSYLSLSVPLAIPSILFVITRNLGPLILLSYYQESLLGVFFVYTSIFAIIQIIWNAISQLLIPEYSASLYEKQYDQLRLKIQLAEKYLVLISILFLIICSFLGPVLINILLGQYYLQNGLFLFYQCALFTLGWGLIGPYVSLIIASGNVKLRMYLLITVLGLSIFSWVFLAQPLGLLALNFGEYNLSFIPQFLICRHFCKKKFGIGGMSKQVIVILIFGVMFCSIGFICENFFKGDILLLIIITFITSAIFFLALLLFKIITKQDFQLLKEIINPRAIFSYFKEELRI